jgi:hypothetical protein
VLGCQWVGHIASEGQRLSASLHDVLRSGLGRSFVGSVAEGNVPLSRREVESDPPPDAFRSSGDQCDVSVHMVPWSVVE